MIFTVFRYDFNITRAIFFISLGHFSYHVIKRCRNCVSSKSVKFDKSLSFSGWNFQVKHLKTFFSIWRKQSKYFVFLFLVSSVNRCSHKKNIKREIKTTTTAATTKNKQTRNAKREVSKNQK